MVFKKEFNLFKSKIIAFSFVLVSSSIFGTSIVNYITVFGEYQKYKNKIKK